MGHVIRSIPTPIVYQFDARCPGLVRALQIPLRSDLTIRTRADPCRPVPQTCLSPHRVPPIRDTKRALHPGIPPRAMRQGTRRSRR